MRAWGKFAAVIAQLLNVILDWADDRAWRKKQARRKNELERVDDWVAERTSRGTSDGHDSDRGNVERDNPDKLRHRVTGKIKT